MGHDTVAVLIKEFPTVMEQSFTQMAASMTVNGVKVTAMDSERLLFLTALSTQDRGRKANITVKVLIQLKMGPGMKENGRLANTVELEPLLGQTEVCTKENGGIVAKTAKASLVDVMERFTKENGWTENITAEENYKHQTAKSLLVNLRTASSLVDRAENFLI